MIAARGEGSFWREFGNRRRPLADDTVQSEIAAVERYDLGYHRQAQAGAGLVACISAFDLGKGFDTAFDLILCHTDPSIRYGDQASSSVGVLADRNFDFAPGFGEFDGVGNNIDHHCRTSLWSARNWSGVAGVRSINFKPFIPA